MSSTVTVDEGPSSSEAEGPRGLVLAFSADAPRGSVERWPLEGVERIELGRADVRGSRREGATLIVGVPDPRMSSAHARLVLAHDEWTLEDLGSKNGSLVNGTPHQKALIDPGDVVELGTSFFVLADGAMRRALAPIEKVAAARVPVLLEGETGTGKERVARTVHAISGRKGAFVAVNCGALPANLVESVLFGHQKGAFTGAEAPGRGLVRAADGGTLFLDEIGDLPLEAQAALLRALQEKEVMPVGSTEAVAVDLRAVAATHRDLDAMVAAGTFREDLLGRLAGLRVSLPPLRDRREDLGELIAELLPPEPKGLTFAPAAVRALFRYPWPRNVRELEQCLEVAARLADGGRVGLEHLPQAIQAAVAPPVLEAEDEQRRELLVQLLREHGGNVSAVARAMGKARMQIQRWMKRYRIRAP